MITILFANMYFETQVFIFSDQKLTNDVVVLTEYGSVVIEIYICL